MLINAQNQLDMFCRNFPVGREVANLLATSLRLHSFRFDLD